MRSKISHLRTFKIQIHKIFLNLARTVAEKTQENDSNANVWVLKILPGNGKHIKSLHILVISVMFFL